MSTDNKETNNETSETIPTGEQAKTAELEAKLAELNEKYLRLYSEFENYRKRTSREKIELAVVAGEEVFKTMLPAMDDLERAMKVMGAANDVKALREGVELIYHKLKTALAQKGLQEVDSVGQPFNTDLHEAVTKVPAPSDDMKGKVVDELEKGYLLNGKVIRFAKVVVGE